MEARHDLRKFITEFAARWVAPCFHRVVNSRVPRITASVIAQRGETATARCECVDSAFIKWAESVDELTMWGGSPRPVIETSTRTGSDQTAAEALQEAETEVGVVGERFSRAYRRRGGGRPC